MQPRMNANRRACSAIRCVGPLLCCSDFPVASGSVSRPARLEQRRMCSAGPGTRRPGRSRSQRFASACRAVVENEDGSVAEMDGHSGLFPPHTFNELARTLFIECKTTTSRAKKIHDSIISDKILTWHQKGIFSTYHIAAQHVTNQTPAKSVRRKMARVNQTACFCGFCKRLIP